MTRLEFFVPGDPAPQGSKRHVGHGVMIESSEKVKPWRSAVHDGAVDAMRINGGTFPLDGALHVDLTFYRRMPASRKAVDRNRGWRWATTKPDIDKLVRSTLDALTTSGLIADDARVARLAATKSEIHAGETGALIEVRTITEGDAP
ncbi:MAG: RusA family crossover junction endodeoxyribonuclease [Ilumatobacteraceae bacterium]|nr:RusA family crossover junction endodeoxyribonuclease [Microthrixaceae bacterium]MBP8212073.1 RusA family crossover junction endodeoxyribonuclease [Ilumatobacteraceae bacterium]